MADFVSIVQIAPNFVIINLESRLFRFSMKTEKTHYNNIV